MIYAQHDVRSPQNRTLRDVRNTSASNPAAAIMQEMHAARQNLPWNELTPAAQAKIRSVVSGNPLFHRMPQQTIYADPEIYQFLLRHPDVVIGFWEHLGATQLSLHEVKENQYLLKETGGTAARVEILYRDNSLCILYARGEYRGPLLAKAHQGDAVLVLRTQYTRDETNEPMVICDLDTFVQINSLGADMLAKLFFSSLTKVAEGNFEVTIGFVSQVSRAATRNPAALKDMAEEIPTIRLTVCTEFCEVVDRTALRFARRNAPTPLAVVHTPQRPQPAELPREEHQDFMIYSRPPADWGMEHFFEPPPSSYTAASSSTAVPFYTAIQYESTDELTAPKPLGSTFLEYVIPKLPKQER